MKAPATVRWKGGEGLVFEGGAPDRPQTLVDGNSRQATSPVTMLLVSLASCTGADVVDIARKMRVPIEDVTIEVDAERADEHPRRLVKVHLSYRIQGGAPEDEAKLQRAMELSHERYCSVLHSLAKDIQFTASLEHEPRMTGAEA